MFSKYKKILQFSLIISTVFFGFTSFSFASTPITNPYPGTSGIAKDYFQIIGYKSDGVHNYNKTEEDITNLKDTFNALDDGIFYIITYTEDKNQIGINTGYDTNFNISSIKIPTEPIIKLIYNYLIITIKDKTNTSFSNKSLKVFGPYKLDTEGPKECKLVKIELDGTNSDNQYYNNNSFYYKGKKGETGKFKFTIKSHDKKGFLTDSTTIPPKYNTLVSGLRDIKGKLLDTDSVLTTPLSKPAAAIPLSKIEYVQGVDNIPLHPLNKINNTGATLTYDWKLTSDKTNDLKLIDNKNIKCTDIAGNETILTSDLSEITFIPDNTPPTVSDFIVKGGNTGNDKDINITSDPQEIYLSALNNRTISIPSVTDTKSGIKKFYIKVEDNDNKSKHINLDNQSLGVTDLVDQKRSITDEDIKLNLSTITGSNDESGNYRVFDWNIITPNNKITTTINSSRTTLSGAYTGEQENKICDMVNNCIENIPTPDFNIVANLPTDTTSTLTKTTTTTTPGVPISNLSDKYTLTAVFKDQYGNDILPVNNVKKVTFTTDFNNTMDTDQVSDTDGKGTGVDFEYKNKYDTSINGITSKYGTNTIKEALNKFSGGNNFTKTIDFANTKNIENGTIKVDITSAVPTYDKYLSTSGYWRASNGNPVSLYDDESKAKLSLTNFNIKAEGIGHSGVGEGEEDIVSKLNDTTFHFDPILVFDYIDTIGEGFTVGQTNNLTIKKTKKNGNLNYYKLNISKENSANIKVYDQYINNNTNATNEDYSVGNNNNNNTTENIKISEFKSKTFKFSTRFIKNNGKNLNMFLNTELSYKIGTDNRDITLPGVKSGTWKKNICTIEPGNKLCKEEKCIKNPNDDNCKTEKTAPEKIDIRGITQKQTNDNYNKMGGNEKQGKTAGTEIASTIKLTDIKADIHKNIAQLLKGKTRENSMTITTADGGKVYYYDTDKKISEIFKNNTDHNNNTTKISRKNTVIIENGNLTIDTDMYYDPTYTDSILGIILIGNTSTGSTSQLKIKDNVTNGVGIVYAEGPVISVDSNGNEFYKKDSLSTNFLLNQLYWKGSFATRNSIGGSYGDTIETSNKTACPYGTPGYGTCDKYKAQSYDLIHLRNYTTIAYNGTIGTSCELTGYKPNIPKGSTQVKLSGGRVWSKESNGTESLTNTGNTNLHKSKNCKSPLIIVPDANLKNNPPYGFSH